MTCVFYRRKDDALFSLRFVHPRAFVGKEKYTNHCKGAAVTISRVRLFPIFISQLRELYLVNTHFYTTFLFWSEIFQKKKQPLACVSLSHRIRIAD